MCLGASTYRSRNMRPSPNAASASDDARVNASLSSPMVRTIRMPRPPPPIAALSMIGMPNSCANASAASTSSVASSVPGTKGRPHSFASDFAMTLSPICVIVSLRGPMKMMPSSSHRLAKLAFSERKPYPGWIACTPFFLAHSMMPS